MKTLTRLYAESTYIEFDFCSIDSSFVRPIDKPEDKFPNLRGYLCPDGQIALWSGAGAAPSIGQRIESNMNKWGFGEVIGYFREGTWLGVLVRPEKTPDWWKARNKGIRTPDKIHLFGAEVIAS